MRSLIFLMCGVFIFFSCTSKEEEHSNNEVVKEKVKETTTIDSLPEARWNGEYMKIDDEDEPRIKRKSQGSDFYNMGNVKLNIGDDLIEFNLFERKKNSLTFTNGSINAIIRSAFGEDLHARFKKNDIVVSHKGKYKADPLGKANNSFRMTIKAGERDQKKEYILVSGEAEVIQFSPRLGTIEVKVTGIFSLEDDSKQKGEGTIKMRFEEAVMTAI